MKNISLRRFFCVAAITMAALGSSASQADTRVTPWGALVSDTCVSPDGTFFTFLNQYGPVGSSCQFVLSGIPGIHFGSFL